LKDKKMYFYYQEKQEELD